VHEGNSDFVERTRNMFFHNGVVEVEESG